VRGTTGKLKQHSVIRITVVRAFCDSRGRMLKLVWAAGVPHALILRWDKGTQSSAKSKGMGGGGACPFIARRSAQIVFKIVPPGVGPSLAGRLAAVLVAPVR